MNYQTYYNQGMQTGVRPTQQKFRHDGLGFGSATPPAQQQQPQYGQRSPGFGPLGPTQQYAQDRGDYAQQMMGQQGQYGQQQPRYGWLQNQKGMERNPLGMMGGGGGMLGGMGSGPQPMYGSSQAGERGGIAEQNFWGMAGVGPNRYKPWEQQTPQMQQGYQMYNRPPAAPINRPLPTYMTAR
jgi:hypothetical protein